MKVNIINTSRHPLPKYATPLSAEVDLHAPAASAEAGKSAGYLV